MKARHLLFVAALALIGSNASAAVTHRAKPVPEPVGLSVGQVQYLYNVGAKGFFLGANNYGTRGSFGDTGYKIRVTQHVGEDGLPMADTYLLSDSCQTASKWDIVCGSINNFGNSLWVDYSATSALPDTLWTIKAQANNQYRIALSSANINYEAWNVDSIAKAAGGSIFVGAKTTGNDTKVYWDLTASDSTAIDWYFVSLDGYKAYTEKLTVFQASENLYEQLQAAYAVGADVAAYEAVYNNAAATLEEINAAIDGVKEAIAKVDEENASVSSPKDETSFITNPSYADNNNTGWSGTTPGFQSYTNAEVYNTNFNLYQKLKGLPKGVYKLTVQGFYRAGWAQTSADNYKNDAENNAKLYAVAGNDTVMSNLANICADASDLSIGGGELTVTMPDGSTGYVPNDMNAAAQYFTQGKYNTNTLYFATDADSALIGLLKTRHLDGDWTIFDNWTLTYYGNKTDAFSMWMSEMLKSAPTFDNLSEDTYVSQSVIDAYNALRAQYTTASSKAEVIAAYKAINDAADSVNTNMKLWKQLLSVRDKANNEVVNDDNVQGTEKDDLADYIEGELQEKIDDKALNNAELRAEIANIEAMMKNAIDNGISPGTDVTNKYLVNSDFTVGPSDANFGWHMGTASSGNYRWTNDTGNGLFEAYAVPSFDCYQEVSDIPVGVYTISVQGFYRYGPGNQTGLNYYNAGTADKYKNSVKVYVNDNTANFKNVFDEHVAYNGNHTGDIYVWDADANMGGNCVVGEDSTYWYPNGMNNSARAFDNGLYTASSYGVVINKGDKLRVGVKGSTSVQSSWAIWDNFKMVYEGTKAEIVKPFLDSKIAEAKDTLANSTRTFGKTEVATTQADVATGEQAATGDNGAAMFKVLSSLITDLANMDKSAVVFDSLNTYAENLNMALATYSETAAETAIAEASTLYDEVTNHLDAKDLETAQAHDYIAKLKNASAALRLPADYNTATPEHPSDMTSMILAPSYDDGQGANSFEGWQESTSHNFGNDDTQKAALLVEYYNKAFNMFQTINGLPDGKYRITVNAFSRYGWAQADYEHAQKNDVVNPAFMYAVADGDSVKQTLPFLGIGAREDPGYSGSTQATADGVTPALVVPNDMVSANSWFGDGYYLNTIEINVKGGTLTIGIRKDKNPTEGSWVILDNWTLKYLGSDAVGIKGVTENGIGKAVVTEVYSVSGARQNGLQKGVNIVKFKDAEGKTTVKKVIIR